jgi:GNAT superfamily N-acetyltransferase
VTPFKVRRTYLRLPSLDHLRSGEPPSIPVQVRELRPCPVDRARELYRQVGEAYHWTDRLSWSDGEYAQWLSSPAVRIFEALADSEVTGFFELVRADDGDVEIAYFGLLPGALGKGLGRWLLTEAARQAFAWGGKTVWLHTCTLDAPSALPNYLARGFEIFRTEEYSVDLPLPT